MPQVLHTTPAGHVDPSEQATLSLYGYADAVACRETARIAVPGGEVHLDIYPAPSPRSDPGEPGDSGRGTVVFVHGMSAHGLMYAGFLDALSRSGWNVVSFDLRGHGRSSGRRGDFTVQSVLDDARGAIEYATERFGGPVGFMGTSLGGFFSLCTTNALDGIACGISHWIFLPGMPVTKKDERMAPIALTLNRVAPWMRMSTKGIGNWDHVTDDPALLKAVYADPMMAWKYSVRGLAAGLRYEPAHPLTDLRVPTLVLIGENDQMTPLAYTRTVFEKLSGDKELVVIPKAGHMGGLVEHRDELLAAIDDFLGRKLVPAAAGKRAGAPA